MLKRIMIIFMVVLLFALPITVCADSIMGNEFRDKNNNKLRKLDRRRFVANGPDGYVYIRKEPDSKEEGVKYAENGRFVYLDSVYNNKGKYWGAIPDGHTDISFCWIPMDQMLVAYVCDDFNNERQNEFYPYTENYDAVLNAKKIVGWEWLGSDRIKSVFDNDSFYIINDLSVLCAYKDMEGREWGYVELHVKYFLGGSTSAWLTTSFNTWICLGDLANDTEIPSFNPTPPSKRWSLDNVYDWYSADEADTIQDTSDSIFMCHY